MRNRVARTLTAVPAFRAAMMLPSGSAGTDRAGRLPMCGSSVGHGAGSVARCCRPRVVVVVEQVVGTWISVHW